VVEAEKWDTEGVFLWVTIGFIVLGAAFSLAIVGIFMSPPFVSRVIQPILMWELEHRGNGIDQSWLWCLGGPDISADSRLLGRACAVSLGPRRLTGANERKTRCSRR